MAVYKADDDGAERHYSRAIAIDPEEGDAHNNLGVLLENKEDYDGAEQHFRRAIAIDPEEGDAHYNLGVLLENKADYGLTPTAVRSSTTAGRGRSTRRSMPTPTASWQGRRGPPGAYRLEHKSAAICMRPRSRPVPPASLHWAYTATPGGDHLHMAL